MKIRIESLTSMWYKVFKRCEICVTSLKIIDNVKMTHIKSDDNCCLEARIVKLCVMCYTTDGSKHVSK